MAEWLDDEVNLALKDVKYKKDTTWMITGRDIRNFISANMVHINKCGSQWLLSINLTTVLVVLLLGLCLLFGCENLDKKINASKQKEQKLWSKLYDTINHNSTSTQPQSKLNFDSISTSTLPQP